MYKLVLTCTLVAFAMAAPKPSVLLYSSPVLTPVSPHVVTSVVSPAVTSYSSYSNSVVHGAPVGIVPVVRQAHVVPVLQQTAVVHQAPVVHSLSYAYPEQVIVA